MSETPQPPTSPTDPASSATSATLPNPVEPQIAAVIASYTAILDRTRSNRLVSEAQIAETDRMLEELGLYRRAQIPTSPEPRDRRDGSRTRERGRQSNSRMRDRGRDDIYEPVNDGPRRVQRVDTPVNPNPTPSSPTSLTHSSARTPVIGQPQPLPPVPPYQAQPQVVYLPFPQPPAPQEQPRTFGGHLRAPLPEFYNGERTGGRAFMMACTNYIELCPSHFRDEQTMIRWSLSFMNKGRALLFAQDVFDVQASGVMRFRDWSDFREEFMREFYPLAEEETATNTLEGRSYFQGRKTMDEYIDTFRRLITQAGYTEQKGIVVKFRRGLDPTIQETISLMPIGRPNDNDPNAWYDMARRIYQARLTNAAFSSPSTPSFGRPFVNRATRPDTPSHFQPRPNPSGTQPYARTPTFQPPTPTSRERHPSVRFQTPNGSSQPRRTFTPGTTNIRSLTLEELEVMANEIAAQRDVLELGLQSSEEEPPIGTEVPEHEETVDEEGFRRSEE